MLYEALAKLREIDITLIIEAPIPRFGLFGQPHEFGPSRRKGDVLLFPRACKRLAVAVAFFIGVGQ
ncbi:hypothetical protein NC796_22960 [Aliifodinibius sp. S!AR15-10]|nr:hypothetical protein [Aliifodinibius sp. S!AR15-10]